MYSMTRGARAGFGSIADNSAIWQCGRKALLQSRLVHEIDAFTNVVAVHGKIVRIVVRAPFRSQRPYEILSIDRTVEAIGLIEQLCVIDGMHNGQPEIRVIGRIFPDV